MNEKVEIDKSTIKHYKTDTVKTDIKKPKRK